MMDEIYLQKEARYQGRRMIRVGNEGILYKDVMIFMIYFFLKKFSLL